MKHVLVIFVFIIIPASAYSQSEFAVSCDNVTRITIARVAVDAAQGDPAPPSENGFFYLFTLQITEAASTALRDLYLAAPAEHLVSNGWTCSYKDISITAGGMRLQSSAPAWNGFNTKSIILPMVRERDALEAARMVCPALEPERLSYSVR